MKTITRNDSRYLPKQPLLNNNIIYLRDRNITNLIKRADEYCEKYNLEYNCQIYKVEEIYSYGELRNNSSVRLKAGASRYSGMGNEVKKYYEVKLHKIAN